MREQRKTVAHHNKPWNWEARKAPKKDKIDIKLGQTRGDKL